MSEVIVREGEDFEAALRRFNKLVISDGTLKELKRRRHYEKPSDKSRREHAARLRKLMRKKVRAAARSAQRAR